MRGGAICKGGHANLGRGKEVIAYTGDNALPLLNRVQTLKSPTTNEILKLLNH